MPKLSYDTAKKLKDAGFSQRFPQGPFTIYGGQVKDAKTGKRAVYIPTLSELIEACGEDFMLLVQAGHTDWPGHEWAAEGTDAQRIYGPTPEEAVANLWLVLHAN